GCSAVQVFRRSGVQEGLPNARTPEHLNTRSMAGTLFVVATPIGHLEDITLRALRVLREVDVIAAEDTRITRLLLDHFEIETPLTSYHQHSGGRKAAALLRQLAEGRSVALVTDAGMP